MASVEGRIDAIDELKVCLRVSIEMLLDRLNDRLHEDMDGIDYLCVQLDRIQSLVERASTLYYIPLEVAEILKKRTKFSEIISNWKGRDFPICFYRLPWKTFSLYS